MEETGTYRVGDRVLFGAAYYYEYQPVEHMSDDFSLMRAAGFNLIRVGESVWSKWEPTEGRFDLDWLAPVIDAAHDHGISVLLGTPTYAVPPWLMVKHPEIAVEKQTGVRVPWGARQEADTSHPVFRTYAEKIIRAVVARYADHPAVVGFQVDNEPGEHLAHNAHVFERFKAWLVAKYGSVDAINSQWNLTHWSHQLNAIDELWVPDGNHVPQYDLEWRRFQAELVTDYISWQIGIVREYARPEQLVTTCIDFARPGVEDRALGRVCDIAAANQYVATQDQLLGDTIGDPTFPPSGSWAPFFASDRSYASGNGRFMVTETNAASIGFPWHNFPAYDGQWRQLGWAMIARGARAIGYWHWHTMHGSWETYWGGILPHSFEPGRVYSQIAALGNEIAAAGESIEGIVPDGATGMLYCTSSRWALEYHPPLQSPDMPAHKQHGPDRAAYERIFYRYYGGLSRSGHQMRILHVEDLEQFDANALVKMLPVLVVPALYISSDKIVEKLLAYARAGGHLVAGMRSFYADEIGRPKLGRQPADLSGPAGVHYDEISNLVAPLKVSGQINGSAEHFIEALSRDDAEELAGFDHPHFGRWSAATTKVLGKGKLTYLGMFPSLDLVESLGAWLSPHHRWADQLVPGRVSVHGATNNKGERLWFVHNWGWEPQALTPPMSVTDLFSSEPVAQLELKSWDVRILKEAAR